MPHSTPLEFTRMLCGVQLKTDLYIDGKWVKGIKSHPVYDPSDDSIIAEIQIAGESECDAAVEAAYKAFPEWAKTAPRYRAEILRKAFEIIDRKSTRLNSSHVSEFRMPSSA